MNKISMTIAAGLLFLSASAQAALQGTMHKDPNCGCCDGHAAHLRASGIKLDVVHQGDLASFKAARNIPRALWSCHTTLIGGYIVEGHVPASAIKKLLAQKPKIAGIAVPGMPGNSPGMEHGVMQPSTLNVYAISPDGPKLWSVEKRPGGDFSAGHRH